MDTPDICQAPTSHKINWIPHSADLKKRWSFVFPAHPYRLIKMCVLRSKKAILHDARSPSFAAPGKVRYHAVKAP